MESLNPQVVAAAKLPILNPNEFDLWKMRIEKYFLMTYYSLWEVILNGDSPSPTRIVDGAVQIVAPTTAEQRLAKKNELKARGTLLMALSDKHQLKFNIHKDAKSRMEAIKKRYGEKQSLDDLFNNLKIYEDEVKGSSLSSQNIQNIAFVSSNNTDNTNESVNAVPSISAASSKAKVFTLPNVDSLSDAVIYSFFASQSNSPQLDNKDLKQIDPDDFEETDLKWQMAMLTIRARRFLKRTERNLGANETDTIGFDMSKVECYNCHRRGHFSRECRSPRDNRNKEATRRTVPVEIHYDNLTVEFRKSQLYVLSYKTGLESVEARLVVYQKNETVFNEDIKLLKLDVMLRDNALAELRKKFKKVKNEINDLQLTLDKFQTSSKNLSKQLESQVNDKTGLGFDSQVFNNQVSDYEELHSHESDNTVPKNSKNDMYKTCEGESVANVFNVEFSINKPRKDMSKIHRPDAPIVEDWIFDSEDETEIESGNKGNAEKASAYWVWKPKCKVLDYVSRLTSASMTLKKFDYTDALGRSNGCSRHMTGNISFLSEFKEIDGGYVSFEGNPKGGKISSKGKIKTGKLDFDDVYFVKELKFNLFSVLQICDKKNSVLFIDTECVVLSSDYKLPDENHVLLRVSRENNMYNVDLKNVIPLGGLTCLFAKATLDESNLWHRRLGHINFKTMNKLAKGNHVRGLPSNIFENNHTCVACQKGKQHKTFCKSKPVSSVSQPLQGLHMDLFGPTFVTSLNKKSYSLVVTDDYRKSPVDSLIGVRDLRAEFEEFSFNSSNRVNAVNAPINAIGPNPTNSTDNFNTSSPYVNVVSPNFRIVVKSSFVDPSKYPDDPDMPELKDIVYSDDDEDVGAEADLSNMETNIPVSPILTTRVHKYHPVNQIIGDLNSAPQTKSMTRMMDVKSAFLYRTIEKVVYVCQPLGFEDSDYPDKGYKVVKALYGLHQAPRAWSIIRSLMYHTSSRPDIMFAVCAWARFQVTPRVSHLHVVIRIFRYLKGKPHLGLWYPRDSPFNLVAYSDSDYDGASLDRKSTTGCCQFLVNDVRHFITAVSYELMLFGLTKDAVVNLMLLDTSADFDQIVDFLNAHTINAKRTAWNEFSCSMAFAVVCLATVVTDNQVDDITTHNTRYTSLALTHKVFDNMRRVGKGFSGVETPLFASMLVQPQPQAEEGVEIPIAPAPPFTTTEQESKEVRKEKEVKVFRVKKAEKGWGKIAAINADEGITLVDVEKDEEVVAMDVKSQERLNQEDVNAASKGVSVVSAPGLVSAAEPRVFDDEDITWTMDQTLIKLKAEKAKLHDEQIAQKLHGVEEDNEMARDLVVKIFMEANKPRSKTKDNVVQRLKENEQRNYCCWFNINVAGSTLLLLVKVDAAAKVLKNLL
nr:putative ribonuclease H-like domain-containing protein [Tanacetum cinerariifolium]